AQTERLLNDPRSADFLEAFVHQWLGLDRIDFFEVNRALYPRFDSGTKVAAKGEIHETFAHILKHNASLRDLLKSDYVVINRVLAHYYGITGVKGDGYEKVSLPKDSPRGGLLGMAGIHFMGGNGERTSPVERGAWVLRKLLHDPPPPAPANVPAITRLAGKVLTTHERLIAHQEDPQCASCHRKIDPVGFGLENFDAIGRWRQTDNVGVAVDSGGVLPTGEAFSTPAELKSLLAGRKADLARNLTERLMAFALGRQLEGYDEVVIDQLMGKLAEDDYRSRTMISEVVTSYLFTHRRVR
ncbi:MAG: DUF1588 domain-containing protein, partial [Planctomycetaceae bacterium]|nr:DUF1588 domain-containing protein [Planctomycetaceae bacterium]